MIERLRQFRQNAGLRKTVQLIVVGLFIFAGITLEAYGRGLLWYTLSALLAGFVIPYLFDNILINNIRVSVYVLNIYLVVLVIGIMALSKQKYLHSVPYMLPLMAFLLSIYIGSFFWLYSNRNIVRL